MDEETRNRAIDALTQHWREQGRAPASVYAFCQSLGIAEREFYGHFASLDAVEAAYWQRMVERVAWAVEAGLEWPQFTARERYLAFLYAFFEAALDERSLLLVRVAPLRVTDRPTFLRGFEHRFRDFAERIVTHGRESGEIAERGRLADGYPRVLYVHLRTAMEFYCRDESAGFERTDAFLEKTVAVAFDAIGRQVVDSAVDLVRFLAGRR